MRLPARQGAPDANQAEIIEIYESLGCSVVDAHAIGFGFPDLVVGMAGETHLVEVKMPNGRMEKSQERFMRDWRGSGVLIVKSADMASEHVKAVRARLFGGR